MPNPPRKVAFVLTASEHGSLIVNRFDGHIVDESKGYGVGFQLLNTSFYDQPEVDLVLKLLDLRRKHYGDGVMAIDCGANIGVHTVEWAKHMNGWGEVLAFEPQERLYYALAGNIALNNCFNARALQAAVGSEQGIIKIPLVNYLAPASFGSLELKKREKTEYIGQIIDYSEETMVDAQVMTLDSFNLSRLDLIKMDVEGMEIEALQGSTKCIGNHHPILLVEVIKSDKKELRRLLERFDYLVFEVGLNFLALHQSDKCRAHIKIEKA